MLRRHLDAKQPIRDEGLLVGGLLDALLARYGASDRKLKRYEQRYLELARDLVQIIYKEVRTKTRSRFQDRLWEGEQGVLNARLVIRYLIQRMARWKLDHAIAEKTTARFFIRRKLGSMLHRFGMSPLKAMQAAYPEHFFDPKHPTKPHLWHSWDFVHRRMWKGKAGDLLARQAIRHLIEDYEGWKLDGTLRKKATEDWFCKVGLSGMLQTKFRDCPFFALQAAYPEHFFNPRYQARPHLWHPWDFVHWRMWWGKAGDELANQAIRHLIEVHEGWKLDQTLPRKVTHNWFKKVGLEGMLQNQKRFNHSPWAVIRFTYPQYFWDPLHPGKPHRWHEWDFQRRGMWQGEAGNELARRAVRHLIEAHEGWAVDQTLRRKLTGAWFRRVGLGGMLMSKFRNSARDALRFAYANRFGPKGG